MVEFDDGLAEAIRGAVQARREDAVSLLQELVRVPSLTGEEGAVGAVVERAFSEETAARVKGLRPWLTDEYEHNGLRADGERILGRLIDLARGRA